MGRLALSLILVLNSFALAACSTYQAVDLPTDPSSGTITDSEASELRAGQYARVFLRSGGMQEGEVVSVSATQVVLLGEPTNRGYSERVIQAADIDRCEIEAATGAGKLAAVAVGATIVAGLVFLWMMRDFCPGSCD